MSKNYDNWERLVNAVLRRERDKQLALNDSPDPSTIGSPSSSSTSSSFSAYQFDRDHSYKREVPIHCSDLTLNHTKWKAMLPPDKHEIVWRSLSFFLDQRTRKNCFLLGALKLGLRDRNGILSSAENFYDRWETKSHPKSRFSEVVELVDSPSFYIQGEIHAKMLSPETLYVAYLVFEFTESYKNIESATSSIIIFSNGGTQQIRAVHFQSGNRRADEWLEVEMGSFFVPRHVKKGIIKVSLWNARGNMGMRSGLVLEGIEFRPLGAGGILSKFRISS